MIDAIVTGSGFHAKNVGSGHSLSVAGIVDKIQFFAVAWLPVASDSVERRQEIPDVVADISLAQKLIGRRPQTSFDGGIEQILKRV